ncbi:MAG: hypothetical protein AAB553_06475 [Patescibacteria group bacterium]
MSEIPRPTDVTPTDYQREIVSLLGSDGSEQNKYELTLVNRPDWLPPESGVYFFQDSGKCSQIHTIQSEDNIEYQVSSNADPTFPGFQVGVPWSIGRRLAPNDRIFLNSSSFVVVHTPDVEPILYDISPEEVAVPPQRSERTFSSKDMMSGILSREIFTQTSLPGVVRDPLVVAAMIAEEKERSKRESRGARPEAQFTAIEPAVVTEVDLNAPRTKILSITKDFDGSAMGFHIYIITVAGENKRELRVPNTGVFIHIDEDTSLVRRLQTSSLSPHISTEDAPTEYIVMLGKELSDGEDWMREWQLKNELASSASEQSGTSSALLVQKSVTPNDPAHPQEARVVPAQLSFGSISFTGQFLARHIGGSYRQMILEALFEASMPGYESTLYKAKDILEEVIRNALQGEAERIFSDEQSPQPVARGFTSVIAEVKKIVEGNRRQKAWDDQVGMYR